MSSRSTTTAPLIITACCVCHQVADDETQVEWTALSLYLDRRHLTHRDVQLSHTYCPPCYSIQARAWHVPHPTPPSYPSAGRSSR